jgi:hypothetical protein
MQPSAGINATPQSLTAGSRLSGRATLVDIEIANPCASKAHARISYNAGGGSLRGRRACERRTIGGYCLAANPGSQEGGQSSWRSICSAISNGNLPNNRTRHQRWRESL